MKNDSTGDLPLVAQIFGSRDSSRQETELLILVTPELVHPMDPEEVPPLPGFDVTEPNNTQFFLKGQSKGGPRRTIAAPYGRCCGTATTRADRP